MFSKVVKISKGTYLFMVISLVHSKFWNCTIEKILKTRIIEISWYYQICDIVNKDVGITEYDIRSRLATWTYFFLLGSMEGPGRNFQHLLCLSVCLKLCNMLKQILRLWKDVLFFSLFLDFFDLLAGLHYGDWSKTPRENRNFIFLIHQHEMWNVYGQ